MTERGSPPSKWIVRVVIGLVVVSQGSALLGDLFAAGIVDREPALLIALNPRNRNLALATNQLSAVTYYVVGFLRLIASDPLYFLLGYWYGERAIAWTERRSRTYGPLVRDGERFFRKASYPLIFLAPNNIICALSAATGVRLGTFIALNLAGTVTRLVLIRQLGEIFSSPIDAVLGFIATYRIPLLILSAIAVAWTIFGEFRGNSELNTLRSLEDDEDDGDRGAGGDGDRPGGGDDERGALGDGDTVGEGDRDTFGDGDALRDGGGRRDDGSGGDVGDGRSGDDGRVRGAGVDPIDERPESDRA